MKIRVPMWDLLPSGVLFIYLFLLVKFKHIFFCNIIHNISMQAKKKKNSLKYFFPLRNSLTTIKAK